MPFWGKLHPGNTPGTDPPLLVKEDDAYLGQLVILVAEEEEAEVQGGLADIIVYMSSNYKTLKLMC